MKNNFKSLLIGTSLSLIPNLTHAQCVATTDCATLGYTETSCPDGKGLRCPFGNTFACPTSEASFCSKYGFKHTCSGTGYKGGAGTACNNQYVYCTCSDGYEWKNDKCEAVGSNLGTCTGRAANCNIADILNSDGTCTSDVISGKTPIGIVIAIKDNCGYAITAWPIQTGIAWSLENVTTGIGTTTEWQTAITNFDACVNTQKIIQQGDSSKYPAAWAAYEYAPTVIPTTKGKWCLPAPGMLGSLYNNLNSVNNAINKLRGTQLADEWIWSSSESSFVGAWTFNGIRTDNGLIDSSKRYHGNDVTVRPVLPF